MNCDVLFSLLPSCLSFLLTSDDPPEELRLRVGSRVCLKKYGKTELTPLLCTRELMDETIEKLTSRSYYSHADTINEGYLSLPGGLRAGICGKAVMKGGEIHSVKEISFLCLRIPRRVKGAGDPVLKMLVAKKLRMGALLYSLPGVGKTTVLRELASSLSSPPFVYSVALIDTRGELSAGLGDCPGLAVYLHYPKEKAISMALRTVSPDVIILDEIGSEECPGLLECGKGGVAVVASAHASEKKELYTRPGIASLINAGVFEILVGLHRNEKTMTFDFHTVQKGE